MFKSFKALITEFKNGFKAGFYGTEEKLTQKKSTCSVIRLQEHHKMIARELFKDEEFVQLMNKSLAQVDLSRDLLN